MSSNNTTSNGPLFGYAGDTDTIDVTHQQTKNGEHRFIIELSDGVAGLVFQLDADAATTLAVELENAVRNAYRFEGTWHA